VVNKRDFLTKNGKCINVIKIRKTWAAASAVTQVFWLGKGILTRIQSSEISLRNQEGLPNLAEATVGVQHGGQLDALGGLVIFEQGGYNAG
jgi:hypothetical protein